MSNDLDISVVLKHPLTPVPLARGHVDGSMHKTDKSVLTKILEMKINTEGPTTVQACVLDAMLIIQSHMDLPKTYGGLAGSILKRIMKSSDRVDFVCDSYSGREKPSLKDIKHELQQEDQSPVYTHLGPEQKRPRDFRDMLNSPEFKKTFLHFLVAEWQKPCYAQHIKGHKLYVGLDDESWLYESDGNVV